ncbi:AraC family transcriptional regulator [Hylemonella gracilis]|uniref:AraC family transcriptional regulator n=1 Tax=Hylemonella gracilis TaxID=80880 RepID=A0A4P6UIA5_9BURK|nr:AraC family transcriptional regulator [Hylemonella gracilis]QBK04216.1 AraC family transcriptional regulator [Hylemonella gracilis]
MVDPMAEVVALLKPGALFSKLVVASAPWAVRRAELGQPFYMAVLEGRCFLTVDGEEGGRAGGETITLEAGDFVLIPAVRGFATSSLDRLPPRAGEAVATPIVPMPGGARVGDPAGAVDVRLLVGHCEFGSPDAALLVPLLPRWLHVRGEDRLATLAQLVGEESRADRPAREIVMARLLEVLLVEAFRSTASVAASPGLVRGLADPKLAPALRRMHGRPGDGWSIAQLAREAALSRSAFFQRFQRAVGMAPMSYLQAWRMALAKQLLREGENAITNIAERVGYGSVSAFGVAFTRYVGVPPGRYARGEARQDAAQALA